MTPRPIAAVCVWIVVTSAAAGAQQRADTASAPPAESTTITEQTYPAAGFIPLRRVERTTASGGRKVIIEAAEAPGIEGKGEPLEEVVTDSAAVGNTITRTQRDVFLFDFDGRRTLAETTQSDRSQGNARTQNVQRTWVADLDGHLILSSGYVEETRLVSPGIQQRNATLLSQSVEGGLSEVERAESTEHQVSSAVVRHDRINSVRDMNGRWVPTEARSGQTRGIGSTERVEEETIQRQNLNGTLVLRDRVVTRTSESDGENRVVIETYSQYAEGFVRSDAHLALQQRLRRSTTVNADGGRSVVEEIEARNPLAPSDPMRVTQRTVVTVRSAAPGRWVTERQMFAPDPNGRLLLVTNDTEETTEK